MDLLMDEIDTPIGGITLVAGAGTLRAVEYSDCHDRMLALLEARVGPVTLKPADDPYGFTRRLRAYFEGDVRALDRDALDDVAVEAGGTPFQRAVWAAVRRIPAGATRTYGEIAAALGRPTAARAVGHANGQNPVCLVIPCHRVVGAGGALTGYAGGVQRKRWLLVHESAHPYPS